MLRGEAWVLWGHFVVVAAVAAVLTGQNVEEDCGRRSHQAVVPQGLYVVGGARNQYQASQVDPSG